MPKKFNLAASRRLWVRRLAWRERRLAVAHKHEDRERITHWAQLVHEARAEVNRRTRQIANRPLRLKAWDQMARLIRMKVVVVGGNNQGPMVSEIIHADGGTGPEPWCGDTVAYCYLRAGCKTVTRAWAAVVLLLAGYATKLPHRGDIVRYNFSHTGLFKGWDEVKGPGWFLAGEGNTGDSGAVSDTTTGHDGVKLKSRHISQVTDFRRVLR